MHRVLTRYLSQSSVVVSTVNIELHLLNICMSLMNLIYTDLCFFQNMISISSIILSAHCSIVCVGSRGKQMWIILFCRFIVQDPFDSTSNSLTCDSSHSNEHIRLKSAIWNIARGNFREFHDFMHRICARLDVTWDIPTRKAHVSEPTQSRISISENFFPIIFIHANLRWSNDWYEF